ncbi:MAG: hypothetical protein QOD59_5203 [Mycobacterium sp.]|jgi:hypothetical protein|nr:hypothetical protein [Mycobacterium sp.]
MRDSQPARTPGPQVTAARRAIAGILDPDYCIPYPRPSCDARHKVARPHSSAGRTASSRAVHSRAGKNSLTATGSLSTRSRSGPSKGSGPRYARMGRHVRDRLSDIIEWEEERLDDDLRAAQPGVPTKHVVDQTVTCNVLLGPAVMHVRVSRACRQQCVGCPAGALI